MSETIKAINTLTAIYKRKIDERDAEIAKLKAQDKAQKAAIRDWMNEGQRQQKISAEAYAEIDRLKKVLLNKECGYIESDHREWMQLACTPGVAWHEKTILKRKYIFCPYCGGKLREAAK